MCRSPSSEQPSVRPVIWLLLKPLRHMQASLLPFFLVPWNCYFVCSFRPALSPSLPLSISLSRFLLTCRYRRAFACSYSGAETSTRGAYPIGGALYGWNALRREPRSKARSQRTSENAGAPVRKRLVYHRKYSADASDTPAALPPASRSRNAFGAWE